MVSTGMHVMSVNSPQCCVGKWLRYYGCYVYNYRRTNVQVGTKSGPLCDCAVMKLDNSGRLY